MPGSLNQTEILKIIVIAASTSAIRTAALACDSTAIFNLERQPLSEEAWLAARLPFNANALQRNCLISKRLFSRQAEAVRSCLRACTC